MDTPRLTEERLRTWLDADQASRERMCLAVLILDTRYSDVQPRRPKGGPDGSRDIHATFEGKVVWGAVGFRNQVSDSHDDKRAAKAKFRFDVDAALEKNPKLWGFVFFTNVDLTSAEVQELEDYGKSKGLAHVDLYWRERIRIALDSREGLEVRSQYLGISEDDKLARLEFLHERQNPLRRLKIKLDFCRPITPKELGTYRVLVVIQNLGKGDPHPTLCVAGRQAYARYHASGKDEIRHGHKHIAWSVNPDAELQSTIISLGETHLEQLIIDATTEHANSPFPTLGSLDDQTVEVYCTPSLLTNLSGLGLIANDYVLLYENVSELAALKGEPILQLPIHLMEQASGEAWASLMPKGPQYAAYEQYGDAAVSMPWEVYRPWSIAFSRYTPRRLPVGHVG